MLITIIHTYTCELEISIVQMSNTYFFYLLLQAGVGWPDSKEWMRKDGKGSITKNKSKCGPIDYAKSTGLFY